MNPNKKYSFLVNDDLGISAYHNFAGMSDYGNRQRILLATTRNLILNRKAFNQYNFTYNDKLSDGIYFLYINESVTGGSCSGFGQPNGSIVANNIYAAYMDPNPIPYNCNITGNQNGSFLKRTQNNILVVRILIIEED